MVLCIRTKIILVPEHASEWIDKWKRIGVKGRKHRILCVCVYMKLCGVAQRCHISKPISIYNKKSLLCCALLLLLLLVFVFFSIVSAFVSLAIYYVCSCLSLFCLYLLARLRAHGSALVLENCFCCSHERLYYLLYTSRTFYLIYVAIHGHQYTNNRKTQTATNTHMNWIYIYHERLHDTHRVLLTLAIFRFNFILFTFKKCFFQLEWCSF